MVRNKEKSRKFTPEKYIDTPQKYIENTVSTTINDTDEGLEMVQMVGTYSPVSVTADDNFDEYEALRDLEYDVVEPQKLDEIH